MRCMPMTMATTPMTVPIAVKGCTSSTVPMSSPSQACSHVPATPRRAARAVSAHTQNVTPTVKALG